MLIRSPSPTLFPYTTLFRSGPKFLHYFPDAMILTSVEFDHADIYRDLDAVKTAFKRLVNLIPRRGRIIALDGATAGSPHVDDRSEEHTSELQSRQYLVCRLL